jgi:ParB-like chromosome segregation protein Spo0J
MGAAKKNETVSVEASMSERFPVGFRGEIDPKELFIVTDAAHPRYDERADLSAYPIDPVTLASIKKHGVMFDVIVFVNEEGRLEVEDGRRRTLHAIEAGRKTIPFKVKAAPKSDIDSVLLSHELNAVRMAPSIMAQARAAKAALAAGKSKADVARAMGRKVDGLKDLLNILDKASDEIKAAVNAGELSTTSGAELSTRPHEDQNAILTAARQKAAVALATDESGKRKTTDGGAAKIATRDVYAAIAEAKGVEIAPSLKTKRMAASKGDSADVPADTGPRSGRPKMDEIGAVVMAVQAAVITAGLSDVEKAALQGAWMTLSFVIDGGAPTPAQAGKFAALAKALGSMRR